MAILRTFGKNPDGEKLKRLQQSPNFKSGEFRNLSETTLMQGRSAYLQSMWKFLNKPANTSAPGMLPSIKTSLQSLKNNETVIVWFGHSSYFIHINGMNILVDPVLSGHASPFSFAVKSFPGSDIYSISDLPPIDILILTHDHYDHLDSKTLQQLKPKLKSVCTSLGVGSHLIYWGFDPAIITELDWWDSKEFPNGLKLTAAPARHFSGRTFKRNQTFWSSFILESKDYKIYMGADSGYDSHFKTIGDKYGSFDIAMLETGQYNESWPLIHMFPEEAVQATLDLKAKVLLPVHWGKFSLAFHPWDDPVKRVLSKAAELNVKVATPMIGEPVVLNVSYPDSEWWKQVGK
jgi:L-ascorbate metabolism protein UlaG (beta-lactamase superfamily)